MATQSAFTFALESSSLSVVADYVSSEVGQWVDPGALRADLRRLGATVDGSSIAGLTEEILHQLVQEIEQAIQEDAEMDCSW